MRTLKLLKEWLFYGHLWIALAAAGLGWMSLRLAGYGTAHPAQETGLTLAILFSATLGVYTLHRLISYRKAAALPQTKRYRIVHRHPTLSLVIGVLALVIAGGLALPYLPAFWPTVLIAGLCTFFYLIPPLPGARRLRDYPYVKVLWVAIAWTLITHDFPLRIAGISPDFEDWAKVGSCGYIELLEYANRFAFTMSIALLFDLRDVELDHSLGVKTVANTHQALLKQLVIGCLLLCAFFSITYCSIDVVPDVKGLGLCITYLAMIPLAWLSFQRKGEDWFAIVVNGLLLLPPLVIFVLSFVD